MPLFDDRFWSMRGKSTQDVAGYDRYVSMMTSVANPQPPPTPEPPPTIIGDALISTGTQYIDTGYKVKDGTIIVYRYNNRDSAKGFLFGVEGLNTTDFKFGVSDDYKFWCTCTNNPVYGYINCDRVAFPYYDIRSGHLVTDVEKLISQHPRGSDSVNVTEITEHLPANTQQTNNLYLFALNQNGTPICFPGELWLGGDNKYDPHYSSGIQIFEQEPPLEWGHLDWIIKHNFLPCKDTNGVVCMYDTVTQRYFYNAGTGDFGFIPKGGWSYGG